ncbi:MAG: 50S ribosomal protein L23 [Bacilli bacterium]|nr:50S ribosomal protein L23 [Bacilli bacterium]
MKLDIIYAPVSTEKSSELDKRGVYVFKVDKRANKTQIKIAIEEAFGVKVKSINTLVTKPKNKRSGKYTGQTKTYKKAFVTLADGQSIGI